MSLKDQQASPPRLPVYVRIGEDGTEHLIGTVTATHPAVVYRAVTELLCSTALTLTELESDIRDHD
jgi:hypothetical protein